MDHGRVEKVMGYECKRSVDIYFQRIIHTFRHAYVEAVPRRYAYTHNS